MKPLRVCTIWWHIRHATYETAKIWETSLGPAGMYLQQGLLVYHQMKGVWLEGLRHLPFEIDLAHRTAGLLIWYTV